MENDGPRPRRAASSARALRGHRVSVDHGTPPSALPRQLLRSRSVASPGRSSTSRPSPRTPRLLSYCQEAVRSSRPSPTAVRSTSSSVVTTMSAPASASRSASSARAIPIAAMSPALAASTPAAASSMTIARSGATPSSRAAVRNISGSGFPWAKFRPETSASKKSSSVRPGRSDADVIPCSRANVSSRILPSNSGAFLDDDAAATPMPASLTAMMNRSTSGYAVKSPASMSRTTISCLRAAYTARRASSSGTLKYASAARAAQARLARHLLLVDLGRERLRRPGRPVADVAPLPCYPLSVVPGVRGRPEFERALAAGAQLADLVADPDADRPQHALPVGGQGQLPVGECPADPPPPELHRERQPVELGGQPGVEVQDAVADLRAGVAALDEIERPGYHAHVDALLRGAALDVADVAFQRGEEPLPRGLEVQRREHAAVRDKAQRGAVRCALVVVGDVPGRGIGTVVVAQPLEQPPQLVVGEQEEQHHRVGLLGELVAVGVVALGTQDPVEPLDVPVPGAVGVPVQLLEILVSLELADDAVAVEGNEHPAAHVRPRAQLFVAQAQLRAQRVGPRRGQEREDLLRDVAQPRHHDVGVGVVAQAALSGIGVLLVELVRPHHAVDLVALPLGIEVRDRGPEARDLQHHLRA